LYILFGGIVPFFLKKTAAVLNWKNIEDVMDCACNKATDGGPLLHYNGYKMDAAKGILEEALSYLA